jgi:hypothetical protein
MRSNVEALLQRYLALVDKGVVIDKQLDGIELLVKQEEKEEQPFPHDTTACLGTALARFSEPAASVRASTAPQGPTVRQASVPRADDAARAAAFSALMRRTVATDGVTTSVTQTAEKSAFGPPPALGSPLVPAEASTLSAGVASSSSDSSSSSSSDREDGAAPHIAFLIRQMHTAVPALSLAKVKGLKAEPCSSKEPLTAPAAGSEQIAVECASTDLRGLVEEDRAKTATADDPKPQPAELIEKSVAAQCTEATVTQAAGVVDWDAAARAAIASGEWKETLDAKKRLYYFHTKEKKSCWNLAKELEKRALAARTA